MFKHIYFTEYHQIIVKSSAIPTILNKQKAKQSKTIQTNKQTNNTNKQTNKHTNKQTNVGI